MSYSPSNEFTSLTQNLNSFRHSFLKKNSYLDAKNIRNYSDKNLNFETQIVNSFCTFDDKIFCFATAYRNEDFYPKGSLRVLNRFYMAPEGRYQVASKSYTYIGLPRNPIISIIIVNQQCSLAKQLGYKHAFISREYNNIRWANEFTKILCAKTNYTWKTLDGLQNICAPESPRCWQHVICSNFFLKNSEIMFRQSLSEKEYLNKFSLIASSRDLTKYSK